ncbi:MAG: hypothetical protein HYU39_06420 [Thaumarchaeota archaeon]|nr:hypothetical protein [Nitrososphaerota archaeon]
MSERQISLDSTVFRNRQFIEWLSARQDVVVRLSVVVYLEALYWFLRNGLSVKDFEDEVKALRATIDRLGVEVSRRVAVVALRNKQKYDFKGHFRDYVVGISALRSHFTLISNDKGGFAFAVNGVSPNVLTPHDFVAELTYEEKTG